MRRVSRSTPPTTARGDRVLGASTTKCPLRRRQRETPPAPLKRSSTAARRPQPPLPGRYLHLLDEARRPARPRNHLDHGAEPDLLPRPRGARPGPRQTLPQALQDEMTVKVLYEDATSWPSTSRGRRLVSRRARRPARAAQGPLSASSSPSTASTASERRHRLRKNADAHRHLNGQFDRREVRKAYLAWSTAPSPQPRHHQRPHREFARAAWASTPGAASRPRPNGRSPNGSLPPHSSASSVDRPAPPDPRPSLSHRPPIVGDLKYGDKASRSVFRA